MVHRHIDDDERGALGERMPVDIGGQGAAAGIARHEGDRGIGAALRRWDAGIGQSCDAGGDAGHDAIGDARILERQRLLAAAAKHERVAALEAQHAGSRARPRDQQARDVGLLRRGAAATLPRRSQHGTRLRQAQHARIDQRVVDHLVRPLQRVQCKQRQQPGIARAGADQPHRSCGKFRKAEMR